MYRKYRPPPYNLARNKKNKNTHITPLRRTTANHQNSSIYRSSSSTFHSQLLSPSVRAEEKRKLPSVQMLLTGQQKQILALAGEPRLVGTTTAVCAMHRFIGPTSARQLALNRHILRSACSTTTSRGFDVLIPPSQAVRCSCLSSRTVYTRHNTRNGSVGRSLYSSILNFSREDYQYNLER